MMRAAVAIAVAIASAMFAFAIGTASRAMIGTPANLVVAWGLAMAIGALVGARLLRHPIVDLDPAAVSRPLAIVSAIATLLALVQLGRLTGYMQDQSRSDLAFLPSSQWEVRHNCATSYWVAARASYANADFYSDSLYTASDDDPSKPRKPLMLGPFRIDVYEYPPPFLLLPRALMRVAPGFPDFRALWFGLSGLFLLAVMLWIPSFFVPKVATRAVLWLPLLWAAMSTISVIQKGNVQPMIIVGSLLAMGLFERRRFAWGGLVLGFAIVSKLYPGMLIVYLLARRQWRAAAWTSAFMLAFAVTIGLELGPQAYETFWSHLPRLLSGEAFPAFRNPMAIANNVSVPGLVFKLRLFGASGVGFDQMRWMGWLYTLVAVAVTLWLAGRPVRRSEAPMVWLVILILATLRSPFLPSSYAVFPGLYLLCLLAARFVPTARQLALFLLAWTAFAFSWPNDWKLDPRVLALWVVLVQALMVGLVYAWTRLGLRAEPGFEAPAEEPAA